MFCILFCKAACPLEENKFVANLSVANNLEQPCLELKIYCFMCDRAKKISDEKMKTFSFLDSLFFFSIAKKNNRFLIPDICLDLFFGYRCLRRTNFFSVDTQLKVPNKSTGIFVKTYKSLKLFQTLCG